MIVTSVTSSRERRDDARPQMMQLTHLRHGSRGCVPPIGLINQASICQVTTSGSSPPGCCRSYTSYTVLAQLFESWSLALPRSGTTLYLFRSEWSRCDHSSCAWSEILLYALQSWCNHPVHCAVRWAGSEAFRQLQHPSTQQAGWSHLATQALSSYGRCGRVS